MQKHKEMTGERYAQPARSSNSCHSLSAIVANALDGKRAEPVKRLVNGRLGYAIHKYPIKGGITMSQVVHRNICESNALFKRFRDAK